jgi:hypothetical protein
MALYVMKQYRRNLPGISAGVQVGEWAIEAADLNAAKTTARKLLDDHQPVTDFVVMWDANGKSVWAEGTDA